MFSTAYARQRQQPPLYCKQALTSLYCKHVLVTHLIMQRLYHCVLVCTNYLLASENSSCSRSQSSTRYCNHCDRNSHKCQYHFEGRATTINRTGRQQRKHQNHNHPNHCINDGSCPFRCHLSCVVAVRKSANPEKHVFQVTPHAPLTFHKCLSRLCVASALIQYS